MVCPPGARMARVRGFKFGPLVLLSTASCTGNSDSRTCCPDTCIRGSWDDGLEIPFIIYLECDEEIQQLTQLHRA